MLPPPLSLCHCFLSPCVFVCVQYEDIITALRVAGEDPAVVLVLLTGAGEFYSSGNDLGNFKDALKGSGMSSLFPFSFFLFELTRVGFSLSLSLSLGGTDISKLLDDSANLMIRSLSLSLSSLCVLSLLTFFLPPRAAL